APIVSWAEGMGIAVDSLWPMLGHGIVATQWLIALGYMLAPGYDRTGKWLRALGMLCAVCALGFHVGAEYLQLRIGWFSYYMVWLACVTWLPERVLISCCAPLIYASGIIHRWAHRAGTTERGTLVGLTVAAAALAIGAGNAIDLPGGLVAGSIAATVTIALGTHWILRGRYDHLARWTAATALGSLCMWVSITQSSVRFD